MSVVQRHMLYLNWFNVQFQRLAFISDFYLHLPKHYPWLFLRLRKASLSHTPGLQSNPTHNSLFAAARGLARSCRKSSTPHKKGSLQREPGLPVCEKKDGRCLVMVLERRVTSWFSSRIQHIRDAHGNTLFSESWFGTFTCILSLQYI